MISEVVYLCLPQAICLSSSNPGTAAYRFLFYDKPNKLFIHHINPYIMKIIPFLMSLLCLFSLESFSQNDIEQNSDSPFESRPFSSARENNRCQKCRKYHHSSCSPTPPSSTPVPFDGGLTILLAAGAAYGVKRLKFKKA